MTCVYCGEDQLKIIDSRSGPDEVIRKRKCLICGKTFYTVERDIGDKLGQRLLNLYKHNARSR